MSRLRIRCLWSERRKGMPPAQKRAADAQREAREKEKKDGEVTPPAREEEQEAESAADSRETEYRRRRSDFPKAGRAH